MMEIDIMRGVSVILHWLVPQPTNNHRPRALHIDSLFAYALLLLVFNFGIRFLHRQAPDVLGYATDITVERLLAATNARRTQAGLAPLRLDLALSRAAAAKGADMFAVNYWAHTSPAGRTPWDFITNAGYRYTLAGENLAKNFQTSDSVVVAWMASVTHRDNLLKAGYRDVGFAVVNGVLGGEETTLVVQMFGATAERQTGAIPQVQAANVEPQPIISPQPTPMVVVSKVEEKPIVNIPTLTREVTFVFGGVLLGILAIDGIWVAKRKIVRLAGHNLAHMAFLLGILFMGSMFSRGSLL